jgi:FlaA1/EpsC-like NDP-sugar epimerase
MVVTLFGLLIVGLFGVRYFARIELTEAGNLMHVKIRSRTLGLSHRGLHFLYDVGALIAACFLAMVVETNFGRRLDAEHVWSINYLLLFVVIGMVLLRVADTYRRVWSRPTFADFFVVGVVLSMSGLLASLIWSLNKEDVTWSDYRAGLLAGQFALWLVLAPRAIPVMLREFAVSADRRRSAAADTLKKRVLVYGAGANGAHLVDFIKVGGSERVSSFQIVGFLDEHRSLKGKLFRSFIVFGALDQVGGLSKRERLDGLVVTISDLSDERWAELINETKAHGLSLYRWGCDKDFQLVEGSSNESENRAES